MNVSVAPVWATFLIGSPSGVMVWHSVKFAPSLDSLAVSDRHSGWEPADASIEFRGASVYQTILDSDTIEWTPLDFLGVEMKILHRDDATGAMAALTRIGPGCMIPAHWHSQADETVYVLEGDFTEDGVAHGPGMFLTGKAGTPHGPHRSEGGCTVLTHFSAGLDFHLVEP